jgi:hypothetical protein
VRTVLQRQLVDSLSHHSYSPDRINAAYCVVLCCVVLCCVVLCCVVLCCLVLSCLVVYCVVLSCLVLCCVVLCHLSCYTEKRREMRHDAR